MLKRDTFYPLHDRLTITEDAALWGKARTVSQQLHVRAVWTGEKRPPRKGEWYLSGAKVEAYRAPNDLPTACPIARITKVRTVLVEVR